MIIKESSSQKETAAIFCTFVELGGEVWRRGGGRDLLCIGQNQVMHESGTEPDAADFDFEMTAHGPTLPQGV